MNCQHFEAIIDPYLDGVLEPSENSAAWEHATKCATCDAVVTSYQQASALLKAAVTDKVAAVDVSGLWEAIEASIDISPNEGNEAASQPAYRARRTRRGLLDIVDGWRDRIVSLGEGSGLLGPVRVGAAMVAVLAIASMLWSGGESGGTPDRVARTKSKAVRIEALEVPSGYTVSTWARPRSRTRMIAINPIPGYTVASASYPSR